jgi:hypothetical protein
MNERIKQFWVEAAKTTQSDSWEEQTKFMERFAKLIIEECIEAARTVGGSAGVEMETIIRNRFGVEE